MTDLQKHHGYVCRNPADRTAALALVDHYQESGGLAHFAALRAVARLTIPIRRAKRLAVAARWLAHRGDVGAYLRREIHRTYAGTARPFAMRVLTDGFRPPTLVTRAHSAGRYANGRVAVVVGAGWVILRVAAWFNPTCNGAAILQAKYGPKRRNKSERAALARKIGSSMIQHKGS